MVLLSHREFVEEEILKKAEDWRDRNQCADDIASKELEKQMLRVKVKMLAEKEREGKAYRRIKMLHVRK